MGMTNAERQQAYRQRHLKDVAGAGERLNGIVSAASKAQLTRLARHYGLSQRATLEKVIQSAERAVVARLKDTAIYYADVTA